MQGTTCRTALVYHERFLWHDPGSAAAVIPAGGMVEPGPHAESPERIRRLNALIRELRKHTLVNVNEAALARIGRRAPAGRTPRSHAR